MIPRHALLAALTACVAAPSPRTCSDVQVDYDREIADISACSTALECGQPVTGTSCGCTRDVVARTDADLAAIRAYQCEAVALDCTLDATSVCDCPDALGFDCIEGTCAFNLTDRYPYLPACPQVGDPYTLRAVRLEGADLVATLSYSGGCASHDFGLCWNAQAFVETSPVTAALTLFHAGGGDTCDMGILEDRPFSVAPLAAAYADAYGAAHATVRLSLDGETLDWTF